MSFGSRAYPRSLHTRGLRSASYIWISDDFLSNLLHQFTLSKRLVRHGSSVPGPLEFRKRASKRRVMNMAVMGAQSMPIDSGAFAIMHGSVIEKGMRWEAPLQSMESPHSTSGEESDGGSKADLLGANVSGGQQSFSFWLANPPHPMFPSEGKSTMELTLEHPLYPQLQRSSFLNPLAPNQDEASEVREQPNSNVYLNEGESPSTKEQSPLYNLANVPLPQEFAEPQTCPESKTDRRSRVLRGKIWELQRLLDIYGGDLDALRAFNRYRDQALARSMTLRDVAFNYLLSAETSMEKILEFLDDVSLSRLDNHRLGALIVRCQTEEMWSTTSLGTWIEMRIFQEKMSEKELLSVLETLTVANSECTSTHLDNQPLNRIVYRSISRGLQNYPFRHGLSFRTLKLMIDCINQNFLAGDSIEMLSELVSYLNSSQLLEIKHELVHFLLEGPDVQLLMSKYLVDDAQLIYECDHDTKFRRLARLLEILPNTIAAECTAKITVQLVERAKDNAWKLARYPNDRGSRSQPDELYFWFSALSENKDILFRGSRRNTYWEKLWYVIEELLVTLEPSFWHYYLSLFREVEGPVFFDDNIWIPRVALQWQEELRIQRESAFLQEEPGSRRAAIWSDDQLSAIFKEGYEAGVLYFEMVRKARVYSPKLLNDFLPRLFSDLRGSGLPTETRRIFWYLNDRWFPVKDHVMADEVMEYCKIDGGTAISLFLGWPNLQLSHCPGLIRALILDPNVYRGTVFNIFYRDSPNLSMTKRSERDESPLRLTTHQAQMLHEMAMAFACAVHLSPAQAFRRVYRCFAHFFGREEDLKPQISQAFVLSGIIRYLEAGRWVSSYRLIQILEIVRKLEGPEVADEVDHLVYQWRGQVVQSSEYKEAARLQFKELRLQSEEELREMRIQNYD